MRALLVLLAWCIVASAHVAGAQASGALNRWRSVRAAARRRAEREAVAVVRAAEEAEQRRRDEERWALEDAERAAAAHAAEEAERHARELAAHETASAATAAAAAAAEREAHVARLLSDALAEQLEHERGHHLPYDVHQRRRAVVGEARWRLHEAGIDVDDLERRVAGLVAW